MSTQYEDDELNSLLDALTKDTHDKELAEKRLDALLDGAESSPIERYIADLPGDEKSGNDEDKDELEVVSLGDVLDTAAQKAIAQDKPLVGKRDGDAFHDDTGEESVDIEPLGEREVKTPKVTKPSYFKGLFDPKIWPVDMTGSVDQWPKSLYIGFLTSVRKRDLISYIDEWITDNNCNRSSCSYQVIAWNGGFAFEVHEGGPGRGVLRSVIDNLDSIDEITIPSNDRYLRVARKFDGFSSYLLNEYEEQVASSCVKFADPMTPVYKRNHGLMVSGVISCAVSLAFLLSSWFLVYGVYDKNKVPVFEPASYEMPSRQLHRIADIGLRDDAYLKSLTFIGGNWKANEEYIQSAADQAAPEVPDVLPELMDPVEGLETIVPVSSSSMELLLLHGDLKNTLAEERP